MPASPAGRRRDPGRDRARPGIRATRSGSDGGKAGAPPDVKQPEPGAGGPPKTRKAAAKLLEEAMRYRSRLEWESARRVYQRIVAGRFRKADGYVGLAKVAFETAELDDAVKYAEKAQAAGATSQAWMILGHVAVKRGKFAEALAYYEKVLKKNPGDKEAMASADLARRRRGK
jgi:tetratricopeptide (TPR) repeat protein